MLAFDTPQPIDAIIEVGAGSLLVRAGDRTDTIVDVRPSHASDRADVRAAEEAEVECSQGRLTVRTPRARQKLRTLFGRPPSVDIVVELPAGSRLDVSTWGDVRSEGRLGDTEIDTAAGAIDLDETGPLKARTAAGNVAVGRASGNADLVTSAGKVRLGAVDGSATVKTANGSISVGDVTRNLRMTTSNGDIAVDRALEGVVAKTANGSVRVGEVVRGTVELTTAFGELEVGVRTGTAAWLDVSSGYGSVRSELDASGEPGPAAERVKVRARTSFGDITIRRVAPAATPADAPATAAAPAAAEPGDVEPADHVVEPADHVVESA